eukprot:16441-Heterococcus_DN1.PRE.3
MSAQWSSVAAAVVLDTTTTTISGNTLLVVSLQSVCLLYTAVAVLFKLCGCMHIYGMHGGCGPHAIDTKSQNQNSTNAAKLWLSRQSRRPSPQQLLLLHTLLVALLDGDHVVDESKQYSTAYHIGQDSIKHASVSRCLYSTANTAQCTQAQLCSHALTAAVIQPPYANTHTHHHMTSSHQ